MIVKGKIRNILEELIRQYPGLSSVQEAIEQTFVLLKQTYENKGKVLVCGNGGSAADAEHIVSELMKGFLLKRELNMENRHRLAAACSDDAQYLADNLQGALPAISLVSQTALSSAYINDVAPDMVFAQQVYGYGQAGDLLIGISTSGNAGNVVNAIKVAKALGLRTIGMTGEEGGALQELCEVTIKVPSSETYKIQELHLPVYHAICAMIEEEFFGTC